VLHFRIAAKGGQKSMKTNGRSRVLGWMVLVLAVTASRAPAEPPAGRLLASQCAQCHGTDGRSVGGIESLAGKGSRELLEKLLEMKQRPVPEELMHRQARGYTDAELRLIADYFAQLPEGSHGDD
jgi:sulfide dehydrogenase cytochrome subunit